MAVEQKAGQDYPRVEKVQTAAVENAPWNYKEQGSTEMIDKLKASIQRDRSMGVVAVRELESGKYEVIDGNHRLVAVRALGWPEITVENFGKISTAEAVVLSRRRNYKWFREDAIVLGELYAQVVVPTISMDELLAFMPESEQEIKDLLRLAGDNGPVEAGGGSSKLSAERKEFILLTAEQHEVVMRATEAHRLGALNRSISDGAAIASICKKYIETAKAEAAHE